MQSSMSVLGLYTYDNTLFANMNYPEGFETADQTNLVNNLLCELAEMEVLYTSPAFMKTIIGVWSYKEKPTWDRIYAAAQMEYNPIENTDYVETYTGSASGTAGGSATDSGKVTTTNKTAGLGGSGYANDNQSETTFGTGADARKTTTSSSSSGFDEHEIRKHGNIGVTTNAQMIESDIDVWKLNNFYDILCSDICKVIALSIY